MTQKLKLTIGLLGIVLTSYIGGMFIQEHLHDERLFRIIFLQSIHVALWLVYVFKTLNMANFNKYKDLYDYKVIRFSLIALCSTAVVVYSYSYIQAEMSLLDLLNNLSPCAVFMLLICSKFEENQSPCKSI